MSIATDFAQVPMKAIGPLAIWLDDTCESLKVPLATFETTLWPSVNRGAKLSRLAGGIKTYCLSNTMTRSIILAAPDTATALRLSQSWQCEALQPVVAQTSRFAQLVELQPEIVGNLIYLRCCFTTGDAAGHNMTTKASDALLKHLLAQHAELEYVSISGNICTDKKVSAVNSLLGRGKHVLAELRIPREMCEKHLRTTPEKLLQLHQYKNLTGGILAGSLRTANAHYANMLLATYLATGQDAANIVEGSQGITHVAVQNGDLVFSVKCPNLIVGTVGNGKGLDFVQHNLKQLGCLTKRPSGENSIRLAKIIAAVVLCGELSLMAAQTNPGELTRSHMLFER